MTRDFNKQRRDDMRQSPRYQSSNQRYREEQQPAHPARPRLNRAMVDRAWESGARPNHPDYRTRTSNGPGDTRRNDRYGDRPSTPPNGRRPYRDHQDNRGPGYRPFNSRQQYPNDRPVNNQRGPQNRPDQNRPEWHNNAQPDYRRRDRDFQGNRDSAPYGDQRPNYRDRGYNRNDDQGDFRRNDRPSRGFEQRDNFKRDTRPPRDFERGNRGPRGFQQRGPDRSNPRWQSRPEQSFKAAPQEEQFEGDYERFDRGETPRRPWNRPSRDHGAEEAPREYGSNSHAGNRPSRDHGAEEAPREHGSNSHAGPQRERRSFNGRHSIQHKDPEFWAEVTDETEDLVARITPDESDQPAVKEEGEQVNASASKKPRTRTSRIQKKTNSASDAGGGIPRPSRRGFKWPSA